MFRELRLYSRQTKFKKFYFILLKEKLGGTTRTCVCYEFEHLRSKVFRQNIRLCDVHDY